MRKTEKGREGEKEGERERERDRDFHSGVKHRGLTDTAWFTSANVQVTMQDLYIGFCEDDNAPYHLHT